jgi:hypothetical protein
MNWLAFLLLLAFAALGFWAWRLRAQVRKLESTPVPACRSQHARPHQVATADLVNILTALSRLYTLAIYGNTADDAIVSALVNASSDAGADDRRAVYAKLTSPACVSQLATTKEYINSLTDADLLALQSKAINDYTTVLGNLGATLAH